MHRSKFIVTPSVSITGLVQWLVAQDRRRALPVLVWLGLLAGALLMACAYAYAATTFDTELQFHIFWLAVLLFTVPAILRLSGTGASRNERLAILAAVGLFDFLPKFLRGPSGPLFYDELAHWRQSEVIYQTGVPFQPNPTVGIVQFFPGLHTLTVALRELSGVPTFQLSVALLALLHALALLGIFLLAEQLSLSTSAAGFAAFVYSLNPSFMFFDTQYAYESMAIVLFIWVLAAVAAMHGAAGDRPRQLAWFVVGLVVAAACIVTHHLTSYIMAGVLLLVAATTFARFREREQRATVLLTVALAGLTTTGTVLWTLIVAPHTLAYLTPGLVAGLQEIVRLLGHQQGSRALFVRSTTPDYERICAYLAPVIVAIGAALGLWLRRGQRQSPVQWVLILFGLLYFPSAAFIFTQAGNEGARRSWAFTYVGLCLLLAPVIPWLLSRGWARGASARRAVFGGSVALLGIVLVGNVVAHVNELYRFPGAYVYGSDTRSLTPELVEATRWFRQTQGIERPMLADRYNEVAFSAFGLDNPLTPWSGFPFWQLYFSPVPPSKNLLREMQGASVQYMVIDKRMTNNLPHLGDYFVGEEPYQVTPPPPHAISKFEAWPWAIKIYESDNLQIYRYDFAALYMASSAAGGRR